MVEFITSAPSVPGIAVFLQKTVTAMSIRTCIFLLSSVLFSACNNGITVLKKDAYSVEIVMKQDIQGEPVYRLNANVQKRADSATVDYDYYDNITGAKAKGTFAFTSQKLAEFESFLNNVSNSAYVSERSKAFWLSIKVGNKWLPDTQSTVAYAIHRYLWNALAEHNERFFKTVAPSAKFVVNGFYNVYDTVLYPVRIDTVILRRSDRYGYIGASVILENLIDQQIVGGNIDLSMVNNDDKEVGLPWPGEGIIQINQPLEPHAQQIIQGDVKCKWVDLFAGPDDAVAVDAEMATQDVSPADRQEVPSRARAAVTLLQFESGKEWYKYRFEEDYREGVVYYVRPRK